MNCQNCNATIGSDDIFCGNCGQKIDPSALVEKISPASIQKMPPPMTTPSNNVKRLETNQVTHVQASAQSAKTTKIEAKATRKLKSFMSGFILFSVILVIIMSLAVSDLHDDTLFALLLNAVGLIVIGLIIALITKRASLLACGLFLLGCICAFFSIGAVVAALDINP